MASSAAQSGNDASKPANRVHNELTVVRARVSTRQRPLEGFRCTCWARSLVRARRIVEGVNAGIARAGAQGKTLGRPRAALRLDRLAMVNQLSVVEGAIALGVSPSILKRWRQDGAIIRLGGKQITGMQAFRRTLIEQALPFCAKPLRRAEPHPHVHPRGVLRCGSVILALRILHHFDENALDAMLGKETCGRQELL